MQISKDFAQSIVTEMKKIINQDLNYINVDGTIIASTDKNRIGTFHEAGKLAAMNEKNIVIEYDEQYRGSRKGINLPVYYNNEVIGVIGITGEREEVEKYGKIIKRMTEILIIEFSMKELENKEIEQQRLMLENILFNNEMEVRTVFDYRNIEELLEKEGGLIIVSKIVYDDEYSLEEEKRIFHIFKNSIDDKRSLIMIYQSMIILLLFGKNDTLIDSIIKKIKEIINLKYGYKVKFGIGQIKYNAADIKNSYMEALDALKWIEKDDEKEILYFNNMDIEIIIDMIDKVTAKKYVTKVLQNLSPKEIIKYEEIIKYYEKYNGSIQKISEKLFIHKNTLQYKLDKLYKKTGFDMRRYHDFVILKIAFLIIEHNDMDSIINY